MRARVVGMVGLWSAAGCASPGSLARPEREPPAAALDTEAPAGTIGSDDIDARLDREIQLHTLRLEHQDPAERARAHMDLANACLQRAGRMEQARFELDEARFEAAGPRHAEFERLDADLGARQARWLQRAASSYGAVLDSTDPVTARLRPEARYGRAEVRIQQGDRTGAHDDLMALVREDPDHPLVGPALLQLADDAFARGLFDEARVLYQRVAVLPAARDRAYASYKLGWIALNLGEHQAALEHFTGVVALSRGQPGQQPLAEAAARDCVRPYVEVGRPERARVFFTRLYPELAPLLLRDLAQRYVDEGRPEAAALVQGGGPTPP